ncbi:MAG TPA: hypothetical protein VK066_20745 [Chloroflexota bacterium]|nr:hypothetical protein [Chloroflexota bacterium]
MVEPTVRIATFVTPQQREALRLLAEREQTTMAELLRRWIREAIKQLQAA